MQGQAGSSSSSLLRPRVLVLDDEEMLREILTLTLGQLGYQADTCSDGEEALRLYRQAQSQQAHYRLCIFDLTIRGGQGGLEAAHHLLQHDPQALIVVTSGYPNDPVMLDPHHYGFKAALFKPFTIADLRRVIQQATGSIA